MRLRVIKRIALALLVACHPGPTAAVTVLAALLAVSFELDLSGIAVLTLAVFSGQLTIGWSNDLIDRHRDRISGRANKPLAIGTLAPSSVWIAIAIALLVSVISSLLAGVSSGLVQLILVVGSGWTYNLILKRTMASFLPYAVAFGSLPAVVSLAADPAQPPPLWMIITGALLGVGAHLANALPDLAQDAATGVCGLPHRLGARVVRAVAPVILVLATTIVVLWPSGPVPWWAWCGLAIAIMLAGLSWFGRDQTAFRIVIGIAFIDVLMLVGQEMLA